MSYLAYKLMHLFGIFTLITALATKAVYALTSDQTDATTLRWIKTANIVSVILVITGGFGMLARLGIAHTGLPAWVHAKVAIWILFIVAAAVPARGRSYARALLIALPLLAITAGYIALYKPF